MWGCRLTCLHQILTRPMIPWRKCFQYEKNWLQNWWRLSGQAYQRTDRRTDGRTDRRTDRWTDRRTDRRANATILLLRNSFEKLGSKWFGEKRGRIHSHKSILESWKAEVYYKCTTDGRTDGPTNRQMDGRTDSRSKSRFVATKKLVSPIKKWPLDPKNTLDEE